MIKKGATIWARQTIDSDVFYYKPAMWFKIWFYIVNKVSHKNTKLFKRGEAIIRYKDIMRDCKTSKRVVEGFMRWAEKETMLVTKKTTRGRKRFVVGYGKFQDLNNYKETGEGTREVTKRRLKGDLKGVSIYKNEKNVKNEKNEKEKKKITKKKKIKYLDFVFLSEIEKEKLITRFGDKIITEYINRLNNYIGAKGDPYKSHYHALLNWLDMGGVEGVKQSPPEKYDGIPAYKKL